MQVMKNRASKRTKKIQHKLSNIKGGMKKGKNKTILNKAIKNPQGSVK